MHFAVMHQHHASEVSLWGQQ